MAKMTIVQALNHALQQEMENDDDVIVLGEDVGVDGGVFRVTEGLLEEYGEERLIGFINNYCKKNFPEIKKRLMEELNKFSDRQELADDATFAMIMLD